MGDVMSVLFRDGPYKTNKTSTVIGFLVRCYNVLMFCHFAPPFAYDEYTLYQKNV